jgi:RNAse (barnase) inhibitor barstar
MDVHSLFRAAPPYLHLWVTPLAEAYEFAWSIQQTPGRQAVVRVIRGAKSRSSDEFFNECGAALQLPDYFGENWDALLECLTDLEWLPGDAYLIVVTEAHLVFDREPDEFAHLLTVLDKAAQDWAEAEDSQGTPRPFHIVFQAVTADAARPLEAKIRQTGHPLEVL